MNEQQISKFGWTRDAPDWRDRIFNLEEVIHPEAALPSSVDLTGELPPVYNQGQLGSCVANATAAVLQHQQLRQAETEGTHPPSRLFIYWNGRKLEGQPTNEDTGMQVRDGIKVLVKLGAPPESDWPYSDLNPGPFQQKPPNVAFSDAKKFEATVYQRIVVNSPGAPMRTAIHNHQPIAFGFTVPDYFEDAGWDQANEPLPLPGPDTTSIGGHAVVVVGYDWTRFPTPVFKIRNSWGADWGSMNGHFWMPAAWFDPWRNLTADLWTVKRVS